MPPLKLRSTTLMRLLLRGFTLGCWVTLAGGLSAAAVVVVGTDHIRIEGGGGAFSIQLDQEFEASDPNSGRDVTGYGFALILGSEGNEFISQGTALDEGVEVYLVQPGDVFSRDQILGGAFTQIRFEEIYDVTANPILAVVTPSADGDLGLFEPAYGWLELRLIGSGEVSLIDHAVAYGAEGIVVGTTQAVPEPSGAGLTLLGLALGAGLRRR